MFELMVKNINGKQVATVTKKSGQQYVIQSEDELVEKRIKEAIDKASINGIPLRFDKRQRMQQGIRYQRLASWQKPEDDDFLEALAEYLVRYKLIAYTVEKDSVV